MHLTPLDATQHCQRHLSQCPMDVTHTYTQICTHANKYAHTQTNMHTRKHTHTHTNTHTNTHKHMQTHTNTYTWNKLVGGVSSLQGSCAPS